MELQAEPTGKSIFVLALSDIAEVVNEFRKYKLISFGIFYNSITPAGMQSDGHLVSTFYITKPSLHLPHQLPSTSTSSHYENNFAIPLSEHQNISTIHEQAVRVKRGYSKVYHMVSKQINCSAAVKVGDKMKFTKMQSQTQQIESTLQNQLDLYLKGWPDISQTDRSPKRNKSAKKTTYVRYETFSHDPEVDSSQEDIRLTLNTKHPKKHVGYYQRMRNHLTAKIDHLVSKDSQNNKHRIHPVETAEAGKTEVRKILKEKQKMRKNQALRLSRTGLQIRLLEIDRTAKGTNLAMIEDHKAKKDTLFQKSLLKNCNAILSDIQTYQQLMCAPHNVESSQSSLHLQPQPLPTPSHSRHPTTLTPNRSNNLQKLKWRQKYLQIESQCLQTRRRDGKLRGGLQIFKKYCGRISKKMNNDQKSIKNILQKEQRSQGDKEIYQNSGIA